MTTLSTKAMSDIEKYNKLREQEILDSTKGENTMIKEMNTFNNKLFSMSIEDLNITKDLIADIIKNKVKSVMKVGMTVNVVQKTKKTVGVITKIMQSKCLVDLSGRIYRVPMSMLEVA